MPVAHACSTSYLGDWDWEDHHSSRPAWANCSQDHISKMTWSKCTGCMIQEVQLLLCECEALSLNPSPTSSTPKKSTQWCRIELMEERNKERKEGRKEWTNEGRNKGRKGGRDKGRKKKGRKKGRNSVIIAYI
jgi:flagellar biosynthesis/type III secretory pathway protein FliH